MPHPKGAIWAERLLLACILAAIGGTLNVIITVHRHAAIPAPAEKPTAGVDQANSPAALPQALPPSLDPSSESSLVRLNTSIEPKGVGPPEPPVRPKPVSAEELTKQALAKLSAAISTEIAAREASDRRAESFEAGRKSAIAESERWKRRELLVRQQIDGLNKRALELEDTTNALDAERDVLARERDALKAALAKASRRSGYAVLPYKGPNGTWRRPIVLECANAGVTLQPGGLSFSGLELSPRIHPRSSPISPIVRAVAREMLHIRAADTPDGAPAVPYLVFLVRPNGVRHYYEARASLEPLGIAFGYELIDQDLAVEIPDLDNLATWDGSVPLDVPLEEAPNPKQNLAKNESTGRERTRSSVTPDSLAQSDSTAQNTWAGNLANRTQGTGVEARGTGKSNDSVNPEDFIWPAGPRTINDAGKSGTGTAERGAGGDRSSGTMGDLANAEAGSAGRESGNAEQGRGSSPAPMGEAGVGADGRSGALDGVSRSWQGEAPSEPLQNPARREARPPGIVQGHLGGGGGTQERQRLGSGSGLSPWQSPGTGTSSSANNGGFALPDLEPAGTIEPASSGNSGSKPDSPAQVGDQAASPNRDAFRLPLHSGSNGAATGSDDGSPLSYPGSQPGAASGSLAGESTGLPATPSGSSSGGLQGAVPGTPSDTVPPVPALDWPRSDPSSRSAPGSLAPAGTSGLGPANAFGHTAQGANQQADAPANQDQAGAAANPPLESSLPASLGAPDVGSRTGSRIGAGSSFNANSDPSSSSDLSSSSSPASSSSLSSSAASQSAGASGGSPMGSASSAMQSAQGSPSLSFGQDSSAKPDSSDDFSIPHIVLPERPVGSIDVAFEIVVVCRENDVLLHPGGYVVTTQRLREPRGSQESLLARELRAMVRKRAIVDPMIRPHPSLKFLVEPSGDDTFWLARRQVLFALPDWPVSLQVSGSHDVRVFDKGTW
jgi:hypothetical protein